MRGIITLACMLLFVATASADLKNVVLKHQELAIEAGQLILTSDSRSLIAVDSPTVRTVDLANGKITRTITLKFNGEALYHMLDFSPDNKLIAMRGKDKPYEKEDNIHTGDVIFFNFPTGPHLRTTDFGIYPQGTFSPNSKHFVGYGFKGDQAEIFDVKTRRIIKKISESRGPGRKCWLQS